MRNATGLVCLCFLFSASLCLAPCEIGAAWPSGGLLVCGAAGQQEWVRIVPDGVGGTIVAWDDRRVTPRKIYAQRIDGSGIPYWTENGVQVSGTGDYRLLAMVSDGAEGAILVILGQDNNAYAQRIDGSGANLWGPNGVQVIWGRPEEPVAVADGAGGIIMVYRIQGGYLYAQKVNAAGELVWDDYPGGHVVVSNASLEEREARLASDGLGGALIVFTSGGGTNPPIYAQRVFASGAVWAPNGVMVRTVGGGVKLGQAAISGDGTGGAFVTWFEQTSGTGQDIFVRRLDASGLLQWTAARPVCSANGNESQPHIIADGRGGAYITWQDFRGSSWDIYAQRIDFYGNSLWTTDGVLVCGMSNTQEQPKLFPSGAGFIAVWVDRRSEPALYAQRIDMVGARMWNSGGVKVTGDNFNVNDFDVASDGIGGLLAAFSDNLPGQDVLAQSLDALGQPSAPEPAIVGVSDVPGDQGGHVRLAIGASRRDDNSLAEARATRYDVWQRIDDPAALAPTAASLLEIIGDPVALAPPAANLLESAPGAAAPSAGEALVAGAGGGLILESGEGRILITAPTSVLPGGAWELVGSFDALQLDEYTFRASTLADSSGAGIPYSIYVVTCHTTDPGVWFVSAPDSGYSVDNLAPAPPLGFAAEQSYSPAGLELTWDGNTEKDLWYYGVYRGTESGFVPGPANLIATPQAGAWFDGDWSWDADYWYKVSAVDVHGNESGFAVLGPQDITGADPALPSAVSLAQNYPNPFNPSTTIRFDLPRARHVRIAVYDAGGRLVDVLLDRRMDAGRSEIAWDGRTGRGRPAASGVYYCEMTAEGFEQTRKMILLR